MTAANSKSKAWIESDQDDPNYSRPSTGTSVSPLAIMSLVPMTSTALSFRAPQAKESPLPIERPTRISSAEPKLSASQEIKELKAKSGLTWDRLGQIFAVSRRTLHNWADGKAINSENHEKLMNVILCLDKVSQGNAGLNRRMLLIARGGIIPIDLLIQGKFKEFHDLLQGVKLTKPRELSAEEKHARAPVAPALLMGTRSDPVHEQPDRPRRKAKTKRVLPDGSGRPK